MYVIISLCLSFTVKLIKVIMPVPTTIVVKKKLAGYRNLKNVNEK
jgi:hypothetical protein